jgi:hypothetical protein
MRGVKCWHANLLDFVENVYLLILSTYKFYCSKYRLLAHFGFVDNAGTETV